MKHERVRRRLLYGITAASWLAVGHFGATAIKYPEDVTYRVWLMMALVVAGCLCTASLFASYIVPLEKVYRTGYDAGRQAADSSTYRPMLVAVNDRRGSNVTPIRQIRSDN